MNISELIAALRLPDSTRVNQRVPKKLLLENGAATVADRRHINEGVEEFYWVATLKPTTIGMPAFCDKVREYLEINVLSISLRVGAKAGRLIELVHRAVPYPILLVIDAMARPGISLAHKRWSQGEASKTIIDGEVVTVLRDTALAGELWAAFCEALALGRQPGSSLFTLYQGWVDTLHALHAARVTGTFLMPKSPVQGAARREALQDYFRVKAEIISLRFAAEKETQLNRQVELNLEIKKREADLAKAKRKLNWEK